MNCIKPFVKRTFRTLFLFVLLLSAAGTLHGQPAHPPVDSIGPAFNPKEVVLTPAPADLPAITEYGTTWEEILREGLKRFLWEPLGDGPDFRWDYAVFLLGHGTPMGIMTDLFLKEVAPLIFRDPGLRKCLYDWAMPWYLKAFGKMPGDIQQAYYQQLLQARDYLAGFDLTAERADLEADEQGFASRKGRLNAFLFRRINNGQLTPDECRYWMDRILSDAAPLLKDADDALANIHHTESIDDEYFYYFQYRDLPGRGYACYTGIMDSSAKIVFPAVFDQIYHCPDKAEWILKTGGTSAMVTTQNDTLFSGRFAMVGCYGSQGLVPVFIMLPGISSDYYVAPDPQQLRVGFYNRQGRQVLKPEYYVEAEVYEDYNNPDNLRIYLRDESVDFAGGVEVLCKGDAYGVCDTSGKWLLPCKYTLIREAPVFDHQTDRVLLVCRGGTLKRSTYQNEVEGGKWALFTKSGKPITGFRYDDLRLNGENGDIMFSRGSVSGLLDIYGKERPFPR